MKSHAEFFKSRSCRLREAQPHVPEARVRTGKRAWPLPPAPGVGRAALGAMRACQGLNVVGFLEKLVSGAYT
ncbi:hypothetical protein P8452_24930 [Trifolium repens]|jgi:hypothetical protein|nr:hypothetical protein P8452_24930 [Trifolium repens]